MGLDPDKATTGLISKGTSSKLARLEEATTRVKNTTPEDTPSSTTKESERGIMLANSTKVDQHRVISSPLDQTDKSGKGQPVLAMAIDKTMDSDKGKGVISRMKLRESMMAGIRGTKRSISNKSISRRTLMTSGMTSSVRMIAQRSGSTESDRGRPMDETTHTNAGSMRGNGKNRMLRLRLSRKSIKRSNREPMAISDKNFKVTLRRSTATILKSSR